MDGEADDLVAKFMQAIMGLPEETEHFKKLGIAVKMEESEGGLLMPLKVRVPRRGLLAWWRRRRRDPRGWDVVNLVEQLERLRGNITILR